MQEDDELVEKVARGIFEARSWWMDDPRSWGRLSKDNKSKYLDDASAAIAVMREAGWKGPMSPDIQQEIRDRAEAMMPGAFNKKPATSEGAG